MANEKWESAYPVMKKVSQSDFEKVCHAVAESVSQNDTLTDHHCEASWDLEEWWLVRGVLADIMTTAVGKSWSTDELSAALAALEPPGHRNALVSVLAVHRDALRHRLVQATAAVSHATLRDFDWKLQLAMSSDKLASLQELLVQLDLDVRGPGGAKKPVLLEMDKGELGKLISSLEACGKSVQQLSTS